MVDPKTYPESNLYVNLLGISDSRFFEIVEGGETTTRIVEFLSDPYHICPLSTGFSFTLDHLKSIHRHLFKNLYEWAGEIRSFEMRIGFRDQFTPPGKIEYYFSRVVEKEIRSDEYLAGKPRDYVVEKLARYLGLINMIHPFPDGNGRAQRLFLWQLADSIGYDLNWDDVPQWEHAVTSQSIHRLGDYTSTQHMIDRILTR